MVQKASKEEQGIEFLVKIEVEFIKKLNAKRLLKYILKKLYALYYTIIKFKMKEYKVYDI